MRVNLNRNEIKKCITELIETKLLMYEIDFKEDDLLCSDKVGLDSLNYLRLLSEIEKTLNIRIEDDYWDYEALNTVEKIITYLQAYHKGVVIDDL